MIYKAIQNGVLFVLFTFALVLFQCFTSCAEKKPDHQIIVTDVKSRPRIDIRQLGKQIHTLVNQERVRYRLSTLEWDDSLAGIATQHSRDMGNRSYFAHTSPEGFDFSYRYRQAGYRCAISEGDIIYAGAENIMLNNLYNSVTWVNGKAFYEWNSQSMIAETTVRGWMNSPGHKKNILTPQWRREGIGISISPDDKVYITQNFC